MGKGGEKSTTTNATDKKPLTASAEKRVKKLSTLSTEELRKWALAYNVSKKGEELEREVLLEALVRYSLFISKICEIDRLLFLRFLMPMVS